jgi:hypothetical protein
MVGGLFGVHNIDMGMCSSFARVFDIRKKKSFFFLTLSFMGWLLSNCHVSFIAVHFSFTYVLIFSLSFLHRMASFLV